MISTPTGGASVGRGLWDCPSALSVIRMGSLLPWKAAFWGILVLKSSERRGEGEWGSWKGEPSAEQQESHKQWDVLICFLFLVWAAPQEVPKWGFPSASGLYCANWENAIWRQPSKGCWQLFGGEKECLQRERGESETGQPAREWE